MSGKNTGYISLWRSICDHWTYNDVPFDSFHAWADLLLLAAYEDHKIKHKCQLIMCKRGEVNASITWLAKRWGWGRHKTRDFLRLLESDGMIAVNATSHRTTITIENYSKYQNQGTANEPASEPAEGQQRDSKGTAEGHNIIKNNKGNKGNKGNKEIRARARELDPVYADAPEELHEAMQGFEAMRKKIKAPLTERAFRQILKKVNDYSGGDLELSKAVLDQSTMNGWRGVFPLKDTRRKEKIDIMDC